MKLFSKRLSYSGEKDNSPRTQSETLHSSQERLPQSDHKSAREVFERCLMGAFNDQGVPSGSLGCEDEFRALRCAQNASCPPRST